MKFYEIAQIELALLLLIAAAIPLVCLASWLIRRRHWPASITWCLTIIFTCLAVAWALADSEDGKPITPQLRHYMRLRREWISWTHAIRQEWQDMWSSIELRFSTVELLDTFTIETTNSIVRPSGPIPTMQFRPNLLQAALNQNIKARVRDLVNNGDGTYTVEVQASREIYDEPGLLMYLRRRSDGLSRWVEHESSSFPSNTSENAYTYTFRPPDDVDGYVITADEVLLGGNNGLQIEGVVVVDPVAGSMYEGITGDYIIDDRPVRVVGGVIKIEANTTAEEPPLIELFNAPGNPERLLRPGQRQAPELQTFKTLELPKKLSMPPMDGGAR